MIPNGGFLSRFFPFFIRAAAIFTLCGFASLANWSPAQTAGTGALSGRVVDSSGGLIMGAKIVVTSQATGGSRTVTSNSSGAFQVSALLPELYTVVASKDGFKTLNVQSVKITITETVTLNLCLEIGQLSERVVVAAFLEQLQTESSTLGRVTSG